MTLGPDDLPEDPFGPSGMAQLHCPCTSDAFHFVYTADSVRAICAQCRRTAGEWPKPFPGPGDTFTMHADRPPPPALFRPPVPPVQAGAAWAGEIEASRDVPPEWQQGGQEAFRQLREQQPVPVPEDQDQAAGQVPPLPHFSSGQANVYLDGGPYAGQITWTMPGSMFVIARVGRYEPTGKVRDGRIVYRWSGK
jgi:hypothetical protein